MKKSEVRQYLREYNEQEIFYQEYRKKKREEKLAGFLQAHDKKLLMHKKIYVEEFLLKGQKEFEQEEAMWSDKRQDIEIRKYSRFMPQLLAVHDFFEMVYVVENEMYIEIEHEKMHLVAGDLVLIPPHTVHKPVIMDNTIALQMMIRKSTFQKVFYKLLNGDNVISAFFLHALYIKDWKSILVFHTHEEPDIEDCYIQLFQENYNQFPGNRIIMNNLFEISLCLLVRIDPVHIYINKKPQVTDERMIEILQYIQAHSERITMKELASACNFSASYLSKYIVRMTGQSFSELRQEIRLERAREMLDSSHLQVDDISVAVGYQNVEHFIRLFKKRYEQTPHQYRRKQPNGNMQKSEKI